jgi:hypothetical protein
MTVLLSGSVPKMRGWKKENMKGYTCDVLSAEIRFVYILNTKEDYQFFNATLPLSL